MEVAVEFHTYVISTLVGDFPGMYDMFLMHLCRQSSRLEDEPAHPSTC